MTTKSSFSLYIAILLALSGAAVTLWDVNLGIVRAFLALLLVFVLPGYGLVTALFPRSDLGSARLMLFSVGVSISLAIVSGFVLNVTPLGLQAHSWAILLAGLTIVFCLIALVRHAQSELTVTSLGVSLRQAMMFAVALVIVMAAVVISRNGVAQEPTAFTQLWILPSGSQSSGTQSVQLGVHNEESTQMQYKLQLLVNNAVVQEWPDISLASDGQWQQTIALRPEWAAATSVDAVLYRLDQPDVVYRHTWLQHDGQQGGQ